MLRFTELRDEAGFGETVAAAGETGEAETAAAADAAAVGVEAAEDATAVLAGEEATEEAASPRNCFRSGCSDARTAL
jgi:hypothetical protein